MNLVRLQSQIMNHEGLKLKPYTDTAGILTIGVGRNLADNGISQAEAMLLLSNDIANIVNDLATQNFWNRIKDDDVRARALVDMAFNLGLPKLLTFTRLITALEDGEWEAAAYEMENSKWAKQVGERANDLAAMMRTGVDVI